MNIAHTTSVNNSKDRCKFHLVVFSAEASGDIAVSDHKKVRRSPGRSVHGCFRPISWTMLSYLMDDVVQSHGDFVPSRHQRPLEAESPGPSVHLTTGFSLSVFCSWCRSMVLGSAAGFKVIQAVTSSPSGSTAAYLLEGLPLHGRFH